MPYRFATDRTDDSALASGHVLHSAPGRTGFPVRLATELFQRGAERLVRRGLQPPFVVYDPCCGTGQLLTTLGLLHRGMIRQLIGSDIDEAAVALARRNLALLSPAGMAARVTELEALHDRYDRASHAAARDDARRLLAHMTDAGSPEPATDAFVADIVRPGSLNGRIAGGTVDLVIADVPYGHWSAWAGRPTVGADAPDGPDRPDAPPLDRLLATIRPALAPGALVTLVSGKDQRAHHPAYHRVERWQLGRRRIETLAPAPRDERP